MACETEEEDLLPGLDWDPFLPELDDEVPFILEPPLTFSYKALEDETELNHELPNTSSESFHTCDQRSLDDRSTDEEPDMKCSELRIEIDLTDVKKQHGNNITSDIVCDIKPLGANNCKTIGKVRIFSPLKQNIKARMQVQLDKLAYCDTWLKSQELDENFHDVQNDMKYSFSKDFSHQGYTFSKPHRKKSDDSFDAFLSCSTSDNDWEYRSLVDSDVQGAVATRSAEQLALKTDARNASYQYLISSVSDPVLAHPKENLCEIKPEVKFFNDQFLCEDLSFHIVTDAVSRAVEEYRVSSVEKISSGKTVKQNIEFYDEIYNITRGENVCREKSEESVEYLTSGNEQKADMVSFAEPDDNFLFQTEGKGLLLEESDIEDAVEHAAVFEFPLVPRREEVYEVEEKLQMVQPTSYKRNPQVYVSGRSLPDELTKEKLFATGNKETPSTKSDTIHTQGKQVPLKDITQGVFEKSMVVGQGHLEEPLSVRIAEAECKGYILGGTSEEQTRLPDQLVDYCNLLRKNGQDDFVYEGNHSVNFDSPPDNRPSLLGKSRIPTFKKSHLAKRHTSSSIRKKTSPRSATTKSNNQRTPSQLEHENIKEGSVCFEKELIINTEKAVVESENKGTQADLGYYHLKTDDMRPSQLEATLVKPEHLGVGRLKPDDLEAEYIKLEQLEADCAKLKQLEEFLEFEQLEKETEGGKSKQLKAEYVNLQELEAEYVKSKQSEKPFAKSEAVYGTSVKSEHPYEEFKRSEQLKQETQFVKAEQLETEIVNFQDLEAEYVKSQQSEKPFVKSGTIHGTSAKTEHPYEECIKSEQLEQETELLRSKQVKGESIQFQELEAEYVKSEQSEKPFVKSETIHGTSAKTEHPYEEFIKSEQLKQETEFVKAEQLETEIVNFQDLEAEYVKSQQSEKPFVKSETIHSKSVKTEHPCEEFIKSEQLEQETELLKSEQVKAGLVKFHELEAEYVKSEQSENPFVKSEEIHGTSVKLEHPYEEFKRSEQLEQETEFFKSEQVKAELVKFHELEAEYVKSEQSEKPFGKSEAIHGTSVKTEHPYEEFITSEQLEQETELLKAELIKYQELEAEYLKSQQSEKPFVKSEAIHGTSVKSEHPYEEFIESEQLKQETEFVESKQQKTERVDFQELESEFVKSEQTEKPFSEYLAIPGTSLQSEHLNEEYIKCETLEQEAERVKSKEQKPEFLNFLELEAQRMKSEQTEKQESVAIPGTSQESEHLYGEFIKSKPLEQETEFEKSEQQKPEFVNFQELEAEHMKSEQTEKQESVAIPGKSLESGHLYGEFIKSKPLEQETECVKSKQVKGEYVNIEELEAEYVKSEQTEDTFIKSEATHKTPAKSEQLHDALMVPEQLDHGFLTNMPESENYMTQPYRGYASDNTEIKQGRPEIKTDTLEQTNVTSGPQDMEDLDLSSVFHQFIPGIAQPQLTTKYHAASQEKHSERAVPPVHFSGQVQDIQQAEDSYDSPKRPDSSADSNIKGSFLSATQVFSKRRPSLIPVRKDPTTETSRNKLECVYMNSHIITPSTQKGTAVPQDATLSHNYNEYEYSPQYESSSRDPSHLNPWDEFIQYNNLGNFGQVSDSAVQNERTSSPSKKEGFVAKMANYFEKR